MSAEREVFCTRCGVLNAVARGRCRECGAPLSTSMLAAGPAGAALPRICTRCRRGNAADAAVCTDCGGRLQAGAVAHPMGSPVAEPLPVPLACPLCGTEMEPGAAFLDRPSFVWRLLGHGEDWIPLVFRRAEARRKERVVLPGARLPAQRCPGCNGVWIAPPPPRA